ncbi:MAG: hypothetical protein JJU36_06825 [Phycisphaeraceae bacterium]|nr:hypothetical protein [Phycisphaeraceae bacterium]
MTNREPAGFVDDLDRATSARLSKLGSRPVDVQRLSVRLESQLAQAGMPSAASRPLVRFAGKTRWWRPALGLAAALGLACMLVIIFMTAPHGATAATVIELGRLHQDMVGGRVVVETVGDVDEANSWISRQSATAPALPGHLADARIQSCCLATIQGRLVAVAKMQWRGEPVTLVVADHKHFGHRMGVTYQRDGRDFHAHSFEGVRMVMSNIGTRWLCVMGDLKDEQLVDLAAQIQF